MVQCLVVEMEYLPIASEIMQDWLAWACLRGAFLLSAVLAVQYLATAAISVCRPWRLRGGRDDWFALDLGDFAFPLGTGTVRRLRVLSGGTVATFPALNASANICAAARYASLIPGESRFWSADTDGGAAKILRWDGVFANRDRTGGYSAELRLTNDICRIPLLAGATYTVECNLPISHSSVSSEYAHITTNSAYRLEVSLPLELTLEEIVTRGGGGSINYRAGTAPLDVYPSILQVSGGCCTIVGGVASFSWSCSGNCRCIGDDHDLMAIAGMAILLARILPA